MCFIIRPPLSKLRQTVVFCTQPDSERLVKSHFGSGEILGSSFAISVLGKRLLVDSLSVSCNTCPRHRAPELFLIMESRAVARDGQPQSEPRTPVRCPISKLDTSLYISPGSGGTAGIQVIFAVPSQSHFLIVCMTSAVKTFS